MPRFRQGPLASPPSAPSAPSSLDLNIEKEQPTNVQDYMRWLYSDFRREWLQSLGHPPSAAEQAAFDARPKVAAVQRVQTAADPAAELESLGLDPATALIPQDLAGFSFFTAGKAEDMHSRKALLDAATAHARTMFTQTDPASGAVIEDTAAIEAARRSFETGEYYRDERPVRETVWRALNPGGRDAAGNVLPPPAMPEDFEIPEGLDPAQGLRAKAEGFIHSRQEALRARNIAAILGDIEHGVKGRKKGFSRTQREQMLRDLEGIISPGDYQTLDTALKRETDPTYEPPVPTGGTFGVRGRVGRVANEAAYQANMARLATVEQDGQNAHSAATRDFYAELGRIRFEQELAIELAGPPPVTDPTQRAEIEKELRREVGVKVILQSMRGTDQDFEKMKQKQFLEYADQKEKTRLRRTMEACLGKFNKLPAYIRIPASVTIAAGVGTAVIGAISLVAPAGITFAGLTFFGSKFFFLPVLGGRLVRGGIAGATMPFLNRWRQKKYASRKTKIGTEGVQSAESEIMANSADWMVMSKILQDSAHDMNEKYARMETKEQSWLRKAGHSLLWGGGLSVALGVGPKVANAAGAGLGGSKGGSNWDYMQRSKDTPWPAGLEGKPGQSLPSKPLDLPPEGPPADPFATPPPPSISGGPIAPAAPPTAPGILPPGGSRPAAGTPPSGPRVGYPSGGVDDYAGKYFWAHPIDFTKSLWNDLWNGPPPKTSVQPQAGGTHHGAGGAAQPPVESTSGGSATRESLLPIGRKGPEGALIDSGVSGKDAHRAWLSYVADIKARPDAIEHQDLFKRMRAAGYSNDQIADALKGNGTQKLETLLGQAARRMKGGTVLYDPATRKMSLTEESFLKPTRPRVSHQPTASRPRVSHQPRVARPRPSVVIPDQPSRPSVLEAQPNAPATVAQPDLTQPNLKATGLSSRRWGTDFWNRDFKARGMTVDEFSKRMDQLQKEIAIPDKVVDYSDVVGGGANTYDIEQLGKIADQLKKAVPPGEQSTTTVEQAFQRRSLGNNPPVGRPRAAAPQARATNPVTPTQPSSSGQIRIRPGEETAQMRIEDSSS